MKESQLYHPDTGRVTVSRHVIFWGSVDSGGFSRDDCNDEEECIPPREEEEEPAKRQAESQVTNTEQMAPVREAGIVRQDGDAVISSKRDLPAVELRVLRDKKNYTLLLDMR